MSTVISSPGVQFNEIDLSFSSRTQNSNTVHMIGFAKQGPVYDPIYITSYPEFESTFGVAANAAERYFSHSARQVLTKSNSQLLVTRLPYDIVTNDDDLALSRNVLIYPLSCNVSVNDKFDVVNSIEYNLLEPVSILLDEKTYLTVIQHGTDWGATTIDCRNKGYPTNPSLSAVPIGVIVTNDADVSVNNLFEGFYLGVADNSIVDPVNGFNCITGINAMSDAPDVLDNVDSTALSFGSVIYGYETWQVVNPERLSFDIYVAGMSSGAQETISEIVLKYPKGYKFDAAEFNDSLVFTLFALRKSIYETSNVKLSEQLLYGNMGSLNYNKTRVGPEGGQPKSVFIENLVNNVSPYISVFVNPGMATSDWEDTTTAIVSSKKKIRVHGKAKNLYALGVYNTINQSALKALGNIPNKVRTAISLVDSADVYPIDITCDAGLSTIWTSLVSKNDISGDEAMTDYYFNDEELLGGTLAGSPKLEDLFEKDAKAGRSEERAAIVGAHNEILGIFSAFATSRKDHIHISDPLRHIFVEGPNYKRSTRLTTYDISGEASEFNFYREMYWPLSHLYSAYSTSYVATYPNWFAISDPTLRKNMWIPPSGVVAACIINSDFTEAPAGFTRGVVTGVADTAISPSQKQRDQLYKISQNPITTFPNEGTVIYGQKTLLNKPSAFDRINVRRTFLYLENSTNKLLKYFVFEPNTFVLRQRITATLTNIFEEVKTKNGIFDYRIVCDERNNTPTTIDANELNVDIYVKPTRTTEFILVNFYATRTDQNFNELIGG